MSILVAILLSLGAIIALLLITALLFVKKAYIKKAVDGCWEKIWNPAWLR